MNASIGYAKCVSLLLFAPCILADEASSAAALTPISPSTSVVKVVLVLVGLLALIAVLAWLASKAQSLRWARTPGQLKTIAVLSLGVKEKIAVVQVGEQQLVVGITAHNINLLSELSQPLAGSDVTRQDYVQQNQAQQDHGQQDQSTSSQPIATALPAAFADILKKSMGR